jgi:hypothetical protein
MNEGQKRLWRFKDAVSRGVAPAPADMRALARAFESILKGADPKPALGIAGKRYQGRSEITVAEQNRELHLVIEIEQLRAQGMSKLDAIDAVEQNNHGRHLEHLHRRDGKTARAIVDVETALLQHIERRDKATQEFLRQQQEKRRK